MPLQLPDPLGHLAPLSMIVFAPKPGDSLAALLEKGRASDALQRSAAALARFHSLTIDLGKERETGRTLRRLQRRVARLAASGHRKTPAARDLLQRLEPLLSQVEERRVPTILGLHPKHLRIGGATASTSQFVDVLLADPMVTVGTLLAQLACHALERRQRPVAAARFRRAYADAAGCPEQELAAFEALGLLLRACRRGIHRPADRLVGSTIAYAASLVAGTGTSGQ